MTVNISKPAVNVREKLAELDKPTGIAGEAMLRAETPQEQFNLIGAGRRNIIKNGGMIVNQRATTGTSAGSYGPDRFMQQCGVAASSIQQGDTSSGDLSRQAGFLKTVKLTSTTASTADNRFVQIEHRLEGYDIFPTGISEGNSVTLSFWVKSAIAGTYYVFLDDANFTPRYTFKYEVPTTNQWHYVSHTISGSTDLAFSFNNNYGLRIVWVVDYGPTYTSADSEDRLGKWVTSDGGKYCPDMPNRWASATGRTFEVTGVQLEVGKVATPFEHRSYGEELALCQRYFQAHISGDQYTGFGFAHGSSTTDVEIFGYRYLVPMRSAPTLSASSAGHFSIRTSSNNIAATPDAIVINRPGTQMCNLSFQYSGGGLTTGNSYHIVANNQSAATLTFDAEL